MEKGSLPSLSASVSPAAIAQPVAGPSVIVTVKTVVPAALFSAILADWPASIPNANRGEVASSSSSTAIGASFSDPATRTSAITAANPRAIVVRSNLLFVVSAVSGMAATMLVATSFLHLEGCGTHPLGWGVLGEADNRF